MSATASAIARDCRVMVATRRPLIPHLTVLDIPSTKIILHTPDRVWARGHTYETPSCLRRMRVMSRGRGEGLGARARCRFARRHQQVSGGRHRCQTSRARLRRRWPPLDRGAVTVTPTERPSSRSPQGPPTQNVPVSRQANEYLPRQATSLVPDGLREPIALLCRRVSPFRRFPVAPQPRLHRPREPAPPRPERARLEESGFPLPRR
jgi:hypothetical protein